MNKNLRYIQETMSSNGTFGGRFIEQAEYDYYFQERKKRDSLKIGEICVYSTMLNNQRGNNGFGSSSKVIIVGAEEELIFNGFAHAGHVVPFNHQLKSFGIDLFRPKGLIVIEETGQSWTKGYFRDWDNRIDGEKPAISTDENIETKLIIPKVEPVLAPA